MTVHADLITAIAVAGHTHRHAIEALSNSDLQSFIANLTSGELAIGGNRARDALRGAALCYLEAIHHNTRDGLDR